MHAPDTRWVVALVVARAVPLHRTNSWPFPIATHVPTRKISGHLWGWTLHLLRRPTNRGFRRATRNVNCHFLSCRVITPFVRFPLPVSFSSFLSFFGIGLVGRFKSDRGWLNDRNSCREREKEFQSYEKTNGKFDHFLRKREENIIRLEMAVRIFGGKLKGLFLGGLAGRLQQKRAGKRWLSAGPCRRIRLVCMPIRYRVLVTPARRHSQAEYAVSHGNFRQFAKRSDARLRAVPRSCKPRRNTFSKRAASPGSLYITTVEEYFK